MTHSHRVDTTAVDSPANEGHPIDLSDMSSSSPSSQSQSTKWRALRPWIVCFSAALFFFYEFIQLNMFNSISMQLMHDFHVNAVQLGNLSATYLVADVLFLFPAGIILDRVSVRKVILIALTLCISGTYLFSLATTFWFAAVCHFIAGIGNAFSFLSCIMLASRWFSSRRMALVIGLIVTFAMAGGVVAQTPLTILMSHFGWRHALMLNGLLGFVILFINWWNIQDYPAEGEGPEREKEGLVVENHPPKPPFFKSIKMVFCNSQNWLFALYTSFLNLPIMVLGAVWGSFTLMQRYHLTLDKASYVTSMIFIGTIVGSPLVGWFSDRVGLRKIPMILCGLASIVVILSIIYLPDLHLSSLLILFFLLGLFTSAQIVSYPAITESNSPSITGTAMGLASVLIMGGAAIAQSLFGWLLDWRWNHLIVHGTPTYASSDFFHALIMIPIAFVVGLACVMIGRETYGRPFSRVKHDS